MADRQNPTVSVVIPTYKHRDTVLEALDSVFAQTGVSFEVIVINDGSPDDTDAVLQPLVAEGRIRYELQANQGQAAARNRGIELARGKYIALLDDDDRWPEGKLAWQVAALEAEPEAVLVYGYTSFFGDDAPEYVWPLEDAQAPRGDVRKAFYSFCWLRSPGQCVIRAEVLRSEQGFDTAIWGTDDYDLYLRLAKRGPFLYEHRPALCYRLHAGSASRNYWRMYENSRKILRKHFGIVPRPGQWQDYWSCRHFTEQFTSDDLVGAADAAWKEGDFARANDYYRKALRIKPMLFASRPQLRKNFVWALLGDRTFYLRQELYQLREQWNASIRKRN